MRLKLGVIPAPNSGLWSMKATGQLPRLFRHLGYYAEHFDLSYMTWGDWDSEWKLWQPFHDKTGAQLVHGASSARFQVLRQCDVLRCLNLHATIPAMLSRRPFVVSLGADYPALAKIHGRPQWKWKLLRAVAVRRARAVLVPNEQMALALMERYPYAPIRHHPNWVDCQMFSGWKPLDSACFEQNILFVGRLVKEKNLETLAEAAKRIGAHLVCLGEGPLKGRLLELGATCPGAVEWSSLPDWYRGAAVFALPSLSEGHPKALTEAMASGLPCLVSSAVTTGGDAVLRTDDLPGGISSLLERGIFYGNLARAYAVKHWSVEKLMPREIQHLTEAAGGTW